MSSPYEHYEIERKLELPHIVSQDDWAYVADGTLVAMWKCIDELKEMHPNDTFRLVKTTITKEVIKQL